MFSRVILPHWGKVFALAMAGNHFSDGVTM